MPEFPVELGVEDLAELLPVTDPKTYRLVDCREAEEWQICRIEGAELIPLSNFAEEAPRKLAGSIDQQIIVYCHHGVRSLHATRWLRQNGFPHARSLRGGIAHWADAMDPDMARY